MAHTTDRWRPLPTRPGLRIEDWRPTSERSGRVRMDVAGFVGLTERGPVCVPVVVESWGQFQKTFGRANRVRRLPYAVRHFFENGGRRCVVVRVVHYPKAHTARGVIPRLSVTGTTGADKFVVWARSPGNWGNEVVGRLRLRRRALSVTPTDRAQVITTSRDIAAGTHLRITWRDTSAMRLRHRYVWVEKVDEIGSGTRALELSESLQGRGWKPGKEPRLKATVERVWCELRVRFDHRRETLDELALRPEHPRHIARVINDESRLLRVDSNLADAPLRPQPGASASFALGDDEHFDDDAKVRGTDAAKETVRGDFFRGPDTWPYLEPPSLIELRDGRPLEALVDYNERGVSGEGASRGDHQLQPVTLVAMPDLVHPVEAPSVPDEEESRQRSANPLRFEDCSEPAVEASSPHDSTYPQLSVQHHLDEAQWRMADLVEWCESRGSQIAILELPPGLNASQIADWSDALTSRRAALYAPQLRARLAPEAGDGLMVVGPAGAICGLTARLEAAHGVGAAPANAELREIVGFHKGGALPTEAVLFEERVNLVGSTARGSRVMGSRTTGGDDTIGHLSVRRVLDYAQLQLSVDANWAVFEPNDRSLWRRLRRTLERRVNELYADNFLKGRTAEEAYFIRCDAQLNGESNRQEGRVVAQVGLAVAAPAEFIDIVLILDAEGAHVEVRDV